MIKARPRTIGVPSGIGDNIWLLQKLINANEKFHFRIADGEPRRGKQIFDLLPQVVRTANYFPGLYYKKLSALNEQSRRLLWKKINGWLFFLTMNEHLEAGIRIEEFLPDLETSYIMPWQIILKDIDEAQGLIYRMQVRLQAFNFKLIGLYGSSYSTQRVWNGWDENKWLEFAKIIYEHTNQKSVFIIIGAKWDLDLGRNLVKLLGENKIPYLDTIGQPLSVVIGILKKLNYFIGFPSGLSILNETLPRPTFMFYPPHLEKMTNTWADPERIKSGQYKGCQFCSPMEAFSWISQNNMI